MPALSAGRLLGFRVRLCPAVRIGRHHPRLAHGAEVDPYLAHLLREEAALGDMPADARRATAVAATPSREEVYRDWLAARLAPAARLKEARLVSLCGARLWRKGTPGSTTSAPQGHPRPQHGGRAAIERRMAVFEGTLEVADAAAFAGLLARGVGRHRAFGFGMLLLRGAPGA